MGKHTRKDKGPHDGCAGTLGELIHEAVRRAVELAVEEADRAVGPHATPATLFGASGTGEWTSSLVSRYQL
jgi:hypothetical protein